MASTTHDGDVAARLWTLSEQLTSRAHVANGARSLPAGLGGREVGAHGELMTMTDDLPLLRSRSTVGFCGPAGIGRQPGPGTDALQARSVSVCNSPLVMCPLRWGRPSPRPGSTTVGPGPPPGRAPPRRGPALPRAGPHHHATSGPGLIGRGAGCVPETGSSARRSDRLPSGHCVPEPEDHARRGGQVLVSACRGYGCRLGCR